MLVKNVMRLIWRPVPDFLGLYINKKEYSQPAIKVKPLRIRTHFMAGSTDATVPGFTWAKRTSFSFYDDEEDEYIEE